MERSPLYRQHQRLGAIFTEVAGWEMPAHFQGMEAEYWAARERVALLDRWPVGRQRMTGAEGLDLLHRLSTNSLLDLPVGRGAPTVLTTAKGRIVDYLLVFRLPDALLLLTAPATRQAVAQWIDRYTIVEDVTLEEITLTTAQITVLGPQACGVLQGAIQAHIDELLPWGCLQAPWSGGRILVARTDPFGLRGYDLVVAAGDAPALWDRLMETGRPLGIAPIGEEAAEALRVEAGVPRWGRELGEQYNPLEAALLAAISWEKGCYVGQEVVARLRTYHRVQKYLVGLTFESVVSPKPGSPLLADGKTVGSLTSVAYSPGAGSTLGLGYLRTPYVKMGQEVAVPTPEGTLARATVTRAPEVLQGPVPPALLALMGDEDEEEE